MAGCWKVCRGKDVKQSVKWLQTDLNEAANLISLEFEHGKQQEWISWK